MHFDLFSKVPSKQEDKQEHSARKYYQAIMDYAWTAAAPKLATTET
jgi:hypothetical protein